MDNKLTPVQRKRARREARRATQASPLPRENGQDSQPSDPEPTAEQLWHRWETDLCPLSPEEMRHIEQNRAALIEAQKIDPSVGHVWTNPSPRRLTPEERVAFLEEFHKASEKGS